VTWWMRRGSELRMSLVTLYYTIRHMPAKHKIAKKSISSLKEDVVPDWQKEEVRKRVEEIEKDLAILIDEAVVFDMLGKDDDK